MASRTPTNRSIGLGEMFLAVTFSSHADFTWLPAIVSRTETFPLTSIGLPDAAELSKGTSITFCWAREEFDMSTRHSRGRRRMSNSSLAQQNVIEVPFDNILLGKRG